MMVGFPGETEAAFANLLDFVRWARFDWLGAFPYSREEDTPAYNLPAQVDEETKARRLEQLLREAASITDGRLKRHIGSTLTVLAETPAQDEYGPGWWCGRSAYQAPEVDGLVFFSAKGIKPGDMVSVYISDNDVFDLLGEEAD
jgi:ribosomal protein S12 methylthiotransferase